MSDRLAEEMERRFNAKNSLPVSVPEEIHDAIEALKKYSITISADQILRHSSVFFLADNVALVMWD